MLHYYAKKSFNEEPHRIDRAPIERAWIYGSEVTVEELDRVAEHYKLDRDILNDVRDTHELPRVEFSDGVLYMFVRMPERSPRGRLITIPFLVVLKGSLLITLSSKKYVTPAELFANTPAEMKSMKRLLLQLVNYTIREFQEHIHQSGKYVRNTEQRLRTHDVKNSDFIKFVTVEGDLNTHRTSLSATLAVLNRLRENRHETFNDKECEYIEDMCLSVNQLLVSTESHMQTIDSIRNAYTTISNNTLNQRMKTLTLLTLLVALPNVFYGMYGMNVALPFADEPWAYMAIIIFSLTVVAVAYIFVRRTRF